jgi:hypothetical protein
MVVVSPAKKDILFSPKPWRLWDAPTVVGAINISIKRDSGTQSYQFMIFLMLRSVTTLNPSFPRTGSSFCGVSSMWWEFLMRLAFGLFLGTVAVASLLLAVHEHRKHLRTVVHDHSSHMLSHLTAEEINRRTLKAAAAIDRSHRQY